MTEPKENLIADAVVDAVRKHLPYGAVDNVYWGAMWQGIRCEARSHLSADLAALREENARLRVALEKLARLGAGDRYGNSVGNDIAQEALGVGKYAALSTPAAERESVPEACPMCHGDGMCEQPVAAPAGVEIPKYPKIKCPACGGTGHYDH